MTLQEAKNLPHDLKGIREYKKNNGTKIGYKYLPTITGNQFIFKEQILNMRNKRKNTFFYFEFIDVKIDEDGMEEIDLSIKDTVLEDFDLDKTCICEMNDLLKKGCQCGAKI